MSIVKGDITSGKTVAIFGATGYVGLMLVNRLIQENISLKLFARNRRRLNYLKDFHNFSVCDREIKPENEDRIAEELASVEVLYYLIHSMSRAKKEYLDLELATIVSNAAAKAGVRQIIYLGGLGIEAEGHPLSLHLRSRLETGSVLGQSGVPVTEIRTGVIIGAGSVGFEIIRALALKLPAIPKLSFIGGRCQPIDIDDVIDYLFHVHMHPSFMGKVIEVGMLETFDYDEMVRLFARHIYGRNLSTVSFLYLERLITEKMVARTIALISAIPYELALPLVEGMDSLAIKGEYAYEDFDTSCSLSVDMLGENTLIQRDFNAITPLPFIKSIEKAMKKEAEGRVESFWSMPAELQVLSKEEESFLYCTGSDEKEGLLFEKRVRQISEDDVEKIFAEVKKIGGEHGYWSPQWMWSIRAIPDKLVGGPGLDLGRRTFDKEPRVGERLDFWIVSDYRDEAEKKVLTLKGRLKSPGNSWLQFALVRRENDPNTWKFMINAYFEPSGVAGYLYWYSLFFVHKYIFTAMIDKIIEEALKP